MEKIKILFSSRPFWAALVGLALVCLAGFFPGLPDGSPEVTQAVIVLAAYITGTTIENSGVQLPLEPVTVRLKRLLGSRKFWAAFAGLACVCLKALHPEFPLGEEQLYQVVALLAAYILGVGIEDQRVRAEHI